jgi:uncharacterized membrane protein YfhO
MATEAGHAGALASNGEWNPAGASPTDPGREAVRFVAYEPNRLVLDVETERAAMLVLSENHYPAWRAYVDGSPAHVYRANYTFRALMVPPGQHRVELRYESAAFQLGMLLSGLALVALVATAVRFWARRA